MSSLILWLDSEEARIIQLLPSGPQIETVRRHGPRHHQETLGVNHPVEQTDAERFYHHLGARLETLNPNELLVLGSGPAREHFINHVERHHRGLAPSIAGVVRLERMPDAHLVDFGKDYFRHHHLLAGTP